MPTILDALGRAIAVPSDPLRIVSLVPSLTEWLFAIGASDRLVGVTTFCVQPATGPEGERLRAVPKLGGTKNPDRAAIVALDPDLVIANKEENRERDVVALAAAGLPVYVTDIYDLRSAIAALGSLASLIGMAAAAAPLLDQMRVAIDDQQSLDRARRVLVPIWRDPWMAIGANTYAHDLLHHCGAINGAAVLRGRYPRFNLDQVPALHLDLILLPSEPYHFSTRDLPLLQQVFDGPIRFVDGELLTWYGPRMPLALRTFRSMIASS